MRWQSGRRSDNVEDQRGRSLGRGAKGGGIGVILLALVAMYFGIDPSLILQSGLVNGPSTGVEQAARAPSAAEDKLADFVSVVLADTEDTWEKIFRDMGRSYPKPSLVLFSDAVQSACGNAGSATGPFYCPADRKVYIDLSFYQDLKDDLNAPGDFAQAYVIAHEIGHHVQNLLGITDQVHRLRGRVAEAEYNQASVKLELQADCFAGLWANHANRVRNILEPGDVEEALNAASMIGDDRLQQKSRGYVTPDSFTHGSSRQRVQWFNQGLRIGRMNSCNTFEK